MSHGAHKNFRNDGPRQIVTTKADPTCPTPLKVGYQKRADAKRGMARVTGKRSEKKLAVYRCECGWFHIGTMNLEHRDQYVSRTGEAR